MSYESLELNEEERSKLGGSYIRLSEGVVHFELAGSEIGNLVVMVHGFSTPMFIYDHTFKYLKEQGYRVLRFDLYGRGFSDRPTKVIYNLDLFSKQLYELLDKLGLMSVNFSLIGLSMGGGIITYYTNKYPTLVDKMIYIDPIGFPSEKGNIPIILKIPLLRNIFVRMLGINRILSEADKELTGCSEEVINEYLKRLKNQFKYTGFSRAIRSTILNIPFEGLQDEYKTLEKKKKPLLLLWGALDKTIPFSTSKHFLNMFTEINFHKIDGAGHLPHYTHSNIVNPIISKFLG